MVGIVGEELGWWGLWVRSWGGGDCWRGVGVVEIVGEELGWLGLLARSWGGGDCG